MRNGSARGEQLGNGRDAAKLTPVWGLSRGRGEKTNHSGDTQYDQAKSVTKNNVTGETGGNSNRKTNAVRSRV